jgi:hypothetical protein
MVHPNVAYLGFPHPEAASAASESVNRGMQDDPGERDPARASARVVELGPVRAHRRSLHEAAHKLSRAR